MVGLQEQTWQSKDKWPLTMDRKNRLCSRSPPLPHVLPQEGGVFPLSVSLPVLNSPFWENFNGWKGKISKDLRDQKKKKWGRVLAVLRSRLRRDAIALLNFYEGFPNETSLSPRTSLWHAEHSHTQHIAASVELPPLQPAPSSCEALWRLQRLQWASHRGARACAQ